MGLSAPSGRIEWRRAAALAMVLLCLGAGCKKNAASRRPQPSASNAASAAVDSPFAMTLAADRLFDLGEYGPAAEAYEQIVASKAEPATPELLFRLAVALELGSDSEASRARTIELLRQIADLPAAGRVGPFSRAMLALIERNRLMTQRTARDAEKIKELSDELERLKKIDLRRRPPG